MAMEAPKRPALPQALHPLAALPRWIGWRWETRHGKTTKVPKTAGNRNASTRIPSEWVTYDHACLWTQCDGVGFVLSGVPAKDLVAIDLDKVRQKETGELLPWAAELVRQCASYAEVTPSGTGIRIIGRAPQVIGTIDRRVRHQEGGSFELYACPQARYITVSGERMDEAPDVLADISTPFLELLSLSSEARPEPPAYHATLFGPATDIDVTELSPAIVEHLTTVHEGADRSGNFHQVVAELKEMGYSPASITRLMERYPNGCAGKYAGRLDREVRRSWSKIDPPIPMTVEIAPEPPSKPPHDPETGEIVEPAAAAPSSELPDHLTRPPGLLGELVDWIVATARRPNRVLALGAAMTVLGTLIGRKTAGPTLSGTHLYVVALAPSGAGKDHPLRQVMALMKAANAGDLIGPDEFISMPAVIHFLERAPLSVCPMDEIGAFLKRLSHHRASPYEKSVTKMLRTAWGASFKSITTPEWGSKEMREIFFPAMSIFGVSTPAEFFEALEGGDVINGFLNRFLLLTSDARAQDRNPEMDPLRVPPELARRLARLYLETRRMTPADLAMEVGANGDPRRVEWSRDGLAEPLFEILKVDVERLCRDDEIEPFYARTVEMAVRLATIVAVGENPTKPFVGVEHMRWGAELALWSARRMAKTAKGYIAENQTQSFSNRILRTIERRGGRISHRDLQRALGGAIKSRDLLDIMKNLVEAEMIRAVKTVPPNGGAPTIWYEIPSPSPA